MPFVGRLNIRAVSESRRLVATIVFVAAVPALLHSFENQTITVAVHDVMGSGIPGAKARLLSLDRVFEVKAKADGELKFNAVVPGTYDLEVSASGFRQRIYPDLLIPRSDSQPLDVFLNLASQPDHCGYVNTLDYEAVRAGARILSGYIIDEDTGKGIRGVKIELKNAVSDSNIGATVSGPNGTFAFSDLAAGRFSVRASRNAYEPTEMTRFLVPRENLTILHIGLDTGSYARLSIGLCRCVSLYFASEGLGGQSNSARSNDPKRKPSSAPQCRWRSRRTRVAYGWVF